MTCEEATKLVGQTAKNIGEHFDSVLILTTWTEDGVTRWAYLGSGNSITWSGMARDYLTNLDQNELADKLSKAMSDKEDWEDGEDD